MKKHYQKPEMETISFSWTDAIASCGWSIAEVQIAADEECRDVTYVDHIPAYCTFTNVTGS